MGKKNPSLDIAKISTPAVVPGLTAGISFIADLFLDETATILLSDPSWDNYGLVFADRRGATLAEVPFFAAGPGLDLEAIRAAVRAQAKTGAVRIILNFPQNPTGYSPTAAEADALAGIIEEAAKSGADVLAICDDAYFGLSFEPDIYPESLFSRLAAIHERVLAVKIDGPTKEDYAWGLRMGFVTFGSAGMNETSYDALVKKLMGAIRSSVSCSNTPAQYLMLKTLADPRSAEEKARNFALLKKRYEAVKKFIAANKAPAELAPLPFNSGYFMSFRCVGISAEALRVALLKDHGIGTIALGGKYLRVAFASVAEDLIPMLYKTLYETAAALPR